MYDKLENAIVVELVDTPSWGGGGASCEGSSPSNRTNIMVGYVDYKAVTIKQPKSKVVQVRLLPWSIW